MSCDVGERTERQKRAFGAGIQVVVMRELIVTSSALLRPFLSIRGTPSIVPSLRLITAFSSGIPRMTSPSAMQSWETFLASTLGKVVATNHPDIGFE